MTEPTDETLRRWLLHRLPPADAEGLEQRLLADEDFLARVRAAEADLLDDYARGDLDADDSAIAASRFASNAADRMRLRIAIALSHLLQRSADRPKLARSHRHGLPASLAPNHARRVRRRQAIAAGLFASACAVVIAVIGLNGRGLNPGVLAPVSSPGAQATITLLANQPRGASVEHATVPRDATSVRLQVEVESDDPSARYALTIDDNGRTLFDASGIAVHRAGPYRFVEVVFDVGRLPAGQHRVRVVAEGSTEPASSWMLETRAK